MKRGFKNISEIVGLMLRVGLHNLPSYSKNIVKMPPDIWLRTAILPIK
jgi:hypothetical protein